MSRSVSAVRGLFCGLALIVCLAGIPLGLYAVAGSPFPEALSWSALREVLLQPDDGTIFLQVVVWIGWVAWAVFAASIVVELVSQVRGKPLRVPGLSMPRHAVAPLVAAVLAVFMAAPIAALDTPAIAETTDVGQSPRHAPAEAPQAPRAPQEKPAFAPARATQSETQDLEYEVRQGDSLWQLAEKHYGDGLQWAKIAKANQDLVGERGENFLEPGWVLTLPDAAAEPAPTIEPGTYTVREGDSLSSIAQDAYGDPDAWPMIHDANRDVVPVADQIDVGWVLTIPEPEASTGRSEDTSTSEDAPVAEKDARDSADPETEPSPPLEPEANTETSQDAEEAGSEPAGGPLPVPDEVPPVRQEPNQRAQDQRNDRQAASEESSPDDGEESTSLADWAGPGSALLAAGLLAVMGQRRRRLAISRRPGQRLPVLHGEARQVVTTLRHAAAPLTVAHLDRALRSLAAGLAANEQPLPLLTAVRLDDDRLDCRLATPVSQEPPAPFEQTRPDVWTLSAARADELPDADLANTVPAPYPGLVTLGKDAGGAHILVDLESITALSVSMTDGDAEPVLAALAFELATSSWADDLTLTLVGSSPDLPGALGVDRARHVDCLDTLLDDLEAEAAEARQQLVEDGLDDAHQGRLEADGADAWTPHIILINEPPTTEEAQRLADVLFRVPRVAVASVTSTSLDAPQAPWHLAVGENGSAHLSPLGLTLTPQQLGGEAYRAVCSALRQSQGGITEPAPWWDHTPDAAPPTDDASDSPLPTGSSSAGAELDGSPVSPIEAPAEDELSRESRESPGAEAAFSADDSVVPAGVVRLEPVAAVESAVEDADVMSTPPGPGQAVEEGEGTGTDVSRLADRHRPTLLLLGDVDLVNVRGDLDKNRTATELLEPIAFVYLHPGASTEEFRRALMGRVSDALSSRARRYLGTAPDGTKLFPTARRAEGRRFYQLHEHVTSDWARFEELIDGGINTSPTAALVEALDLVRGRPLASIPVGLWRWAEDWREDATAAIVDTAHELAERSLARGDAETARWAVQRGRTVDPETETLARDELRTERLAGNHSRAEAVAERIVRFARSNHIDLDGETVALLHQVHDRKRKAQ